MDDILKNIKWDDKGLVPVVVQDVHSKKVRMLAYMNKEALKKTIETKRVHYFSRTRQELWEKGETSGHFQNLKGINIDCDGDTLLIQIEQVGGISCHTGKSTCFYKKMGNSSWEKEETFKVTVDNEENMIDYIYQIIKERKENPKEGSYTNYLIDEGIDKILKKVGEESTEVVIASKNQDKSEVVFEISDLIFHLSILMIELGISWNDIYNELSKRR